MVDETSTRALLQCAGCNAPATITPPEAPIFLVADGSGSLAQTTCSIDVSNPGRGRR